MTRIITVASQKGGVGKTTATLNLGYSLSRFGSRVLLIDADAQGGLTIASNLRERTVLGLAQLVSGTSRSAELLAKTRDGTMTMLGSGVVEPADAIVLEEAARDGRLKEAIRSLSQGFDYVFLDAPAGIGSVVQALLEVSDGVVLAVRCQNLLLKSLPTFLRLMQSVRETVNPGLQLEGALITVRDDRSATETAICQEFLQSVPEAIFYRTVIRHDEAFEKASVRSLPVAMLPGAQAASRAYIDLAIEFREREVLRGHAQEEISENALGLF
jgi:chromosome partitioning protein